MAFQVNSTSTPQPFKMYVLSGAAYNTLVQGGSISGHALDPDAFYLTTDGAGGDFLPLTGGTLTGDLVAPTVRSALIGTTDSPNGVYYVEGTGSTAGTWLGSNNLIQNLYKGLCILYKIPVLGASTTTLNLNGFGAITVKRNNDNFTGIHLPVGTVVPLVYDGSYWRWSDYGDGDGKVDQKLGTTSGEYPVLARYTTSTTSSKEYANFAAGITMNPSTNTLTASKIFGAVWNDYAEYRTSDCYEPGRVVCENGDDTLSLSTSRLQGGANIISDTFGFSIGKTDKACTPIAVSGRVLAYPYEDRDSYSPGDAVCSGPNGTVSKMSREEIMMYPDRIIGTVSAIPDYDTWGTDNILVNDRIWIKIH